jgi:hypothetical protein
MSAPPPAAPRSPRALLLAAGLLAAGACGPDPLATGVAPDAPSPERVSVRVLADTIVAGDAGRELAEALRVEVRDGAGRPVPNFLVNFRVVAGGGAVFAGAAITDAAGRAVDRWTLGPASADTQRVEVRAVDPATGRAARVRDLPRRRARRRCPGAAGRRAGPAGAQLDARAAGPRRGVGRPERGRRPLRDQLDGPRRLLGGALRVQGPRRDERAGRRDDRGRAPRGGDVPVRGPQLLERGADRHVDAGRDLRGRAPRAHRRRAAGARARVARRGAARRHAGRPGGRASGRTPARAGEREPGDGGARARGRSCACG